MPSYPGGSNPYPQDQPEPQFVDGPEGPRGPEGPAGPRGATGATGPAGTPGATWRSGSAAPTDGLGDDGDFYLRTTNGNVYKKAAGTYTITANIIGPTGAAGAAGATGATGATGADGPGADQSLNTTDSVVFDSVTGTSSIECGIFIVSGAHTFTTNDLSFFGASPAGQQPSDGAVSAGALYTSVERSMLNRVYAALYLYGLIAP